MQLQMKQQQQKSNGKATTATNAKSTQFLSQIIEVYLKTTRACITYEQFNETKKQQQHKHIRK